MIYMEQTLQLILRENPEMAATMDREGTLQVIEKEDLRYFKYTKNA
jgi:hypothetical protein